MVAAVTEDVLENGDSTAEEKIAQLDDKRRHELKCHEVFLSRQVETLPATHIRGKCSVTLLSEAETPLSYLDQDVSPDSCCFVLSSHIIITSASKAEVM